jgi:hypothetical protein
VNKITAGFLQNQNVWIFLPTTVEIALSMDGIGFAILSRMNHKTKEEGHGARVKDFSASAGGARVRYIRIRAKNVGTCPPWHKGAGGKAWLFVDEIMVE